MDGLPRTVRLAGELADLETFLEDVPIGFHWTMLEQLEEGVYILDRERRVIFWSAGAQRISGYAPVQILGRRCMDERLEHVDDCGECLCNVNCPMAAVMDDGQPRSADVFLRHRDGHRLPVRVHGSPIRDRTGRIIGAFQTFSDITARSAELERVRELEQIAFIDSLTGVANRRYLEKVLEARLSELHRCGLPFATVLCDVDHFKELNDQYGHQTGDRVLQTVARTLSCACGTNDLAGRWGGDEFLVILGYGVRAQVEQVAEQLKRLVAESICAASGEKLRVTISVGAALAHPEDKVLDLTARADALLYQCKAQGRNRVSVEGEATSRLVIPLSSQ